MPTEDPLLSETPPAPAPPSTPGTRLHRALDLALTSAAVLYALAFAALQTTHLGERHVLEWDARAFTLPAWRFHGTGLFPDDLLVDFMSSICTPGWKALYWAGTLVTDPLLLSKLLPFLGLAVVVWHGFALGRSLGGHALGAGCVLLLVHCSILWDRMVGANPRAFGFPLLIVFLRYAASGSEVGTLLALVLQAACYPSIFVVCAPAYGITVLLAERDRLKKLLRLTLAGALALAAIPSAVGRVDPRIGKPPSYTEAAELRQMRPGGAQPFYPLPPPRDGFHRAVDQALGPHGPPVWRAAQDWNQRQGHLLTWLLLASALLLASTGQARIPAIFGALLVSSLVSYGTAYFFAYRLFLPDRLLTYTWPVLFPLALLVMLRQGLARWWPRAASAIATLLLAGLAFLCYGSGLPRGMGLHDWRAQDTPVVRFLATLPPQVRIAAHPRPAAFIQTFAQRQTFLSATTNMLPHGYRYGLEMERRLEAFFRAYYASDLAAVRRFASEQRVDYLVVDERDFGPDALGRARYAEPWVSLTDTLLRASPPGSLALAHPPPASIVFRDGGQLVIDTHKL